MDVAITDVSASALLCQSSKVRFSRRNDNSRHSSTKSLVPVLCSHLTPAAKGHIGWERVQFPYITPTVNVTRDHTDPVLPVPVKLILRHDVARCKFTINLQAVPRVPLPEVGLDGVARCLDIDAVASIV